MYLNSHPIYQQYAELEHKKLGDIFFYDDKNHCFNATLEVFGKAAVIRCYQNGEAFQAHQALIPPTEELEINVESINGQIIFVYLDSKIAITSVEQIYKLADHCREQNKEIVDKRIEYNVLLNKICDSVINEPSIINMIDGFIKKFDNGMLINPDFISIIEELLLQHDKNGKESLIIEELQRKITVAESKQMQINNDAENYFNNGVKLLSQLINEKIGLDTDNTALFVTHKLLWIRLIKFYGEEWENSFSEYFEKDELNLENTIENYIKIKEIDTFSKRNMEKFTVYLLWKKIISIDEDYIKNLSLVLKIFNEKIEKNKLNNFAQSLLNETDDFNKITIHDVDLMSGIDFEEFVGTIFEKMGYSTTFTKSSGDQGIDVICEKNRKKIGIQAKCYSSKVGNSAIQEVVAGLKYYGIDKGIVVTNHYYTESAKTLAQVNNITLWDRDMIINKIKDVM